MDFLDDCVGIEEEKYLTCKANEMWFLTRATEWLGQV